ncbi:conserved exported hypothetical protein [Pseudomonas sp. 8Z]|uniref:hypothetical protein n=1 Tax=Pseudomonas sp. 8Z TaxID=2653166 RepID=UPI0012F44635|nr:hypothetical protein [Pseudomonas sp. 8Z]VXC58012.1 conserved exported hypothetical protein [Pseudomonas sp. 8Z]
MLLRALSVAALCLCGAVALAAEPPTIRVVPKSYVSPGASGSVSESTQYQQYDLYGGQRLPSGSVRQESGYGSYSSEMRGNIRQSTEYPGGFRIERQPGIGTYEQQRSR